MTRIQNIELDILRKFHKVFADNNIDYFLCGGSLLGAIRHKGFIPWDDDIDIGMTRENYNKFLELAKKNNCVFDDRYMIKAGELGNINYPFAKIEDKKYTIVKSHSVEDRHVFIDVFPFDNLPESDDETKKIYKKAFFIQKLIRYKNIEIGYLKSRTKNKMKVIAELIGYYLFAKPIPFKWLLEMDKRIISKYDDSCKCIGGIVWGYGPGEKVLKEDLQTIDVEFEGEIFKGIKGYDKYLTGLYKDYMVLPPKEKRIHHEIEIEENL